MSRNQDPTVTIVKWIIGGFVLVVAIALGYNIYIDEKQSSVVFQPRGGKNFPSTDINPAPIQTLPAPVQTLPAPAKTILSNNIFDQLAGEYAVVFENQTLVEMQNSGIKSMTGKWKITPQGTFETKAKIILSNGFEQAIESTGNLTFENGKVFSEPKTLNGITLPTAADKQAYIVSSDRKELQGDGLGMKLVKQ